MDRQPDFRRLYCSYIHYLSMKDPPFTYPLRLYKVDQRNRKILERHYKGLNFSEIIRDALQEKVSKLSSPNL